MLGQALEFKSGASDLFDNLLLLLCDLVEARKLLKNTDVWVPHADLYDTYVRTLPTVVSQDPSCTESLQSSKL